MKISELKNDWYGEYDPIFRKLIGLAEAAQEYNRLDRLYWETGKQDGGLKQAWDLFQEALAALEDHP